MGISIEDLEHLTVGMVYDMMTERINDSVDYPIEATQRDFDLF